MTAGTLLCAALALGIWWLSAVGASLRRELVSVNESGDDHIDYDLLSRLRRLRDEPVTLALRFRVSRGLAVAGLPAALIGATPFQGVGVVLIALAGGLIVAVSELSGGGTLVRRLSRLQGGAGCSLWAELTRPPARLASLLLPLRARRAERPTPGWVQAEATAASIPAGGRLGKEERRFLRRLLASTGILVADIMTPWESTHTLDVDAFLPEAADAVHIAGHSRLPVLNRDTVVGMVSVRDLVGPLHGEDAAQRKVSSLLRPVYFVRQTQAVKDLLDELQEARVHLGVVLDRMGRQVGVVTIEDALEEIVGELHDERERGGAELR